MAHGRWWLGENSICLGPQSSHGDLRNCVWWGKVLGWEISLPKLIFPRPWDWEFLNGTKLLVLCALRAVWLQALERIKLVGLSISLRKFITVLQVSYPTFLARVREDTQIKNCWCSQAESEICSEISGFCSSVQDGRVRRHNQLCELLAEEAEECLIFQESLLKINYINMTWYWTRQVRHFWWT